MTRPITLRRFSADVQTTEYSAGKLIAWLAVFSALYLLRDIAKIPVPEIVFTAVAALAFWLTDASSAMGFYLFTSTLTVPDFEIRFVYLVVLLAKAFFYKKKLHAGMLLVILALATLELVDLFIFFQESWFGVLYECALRLSFAALPIFWMSENISAKAYRRALLCYLAGTLLGGAVLLILSIDNVGWEQLLTGAGMRLGKATTKGYETGATMQTGYNANQLAGMFAVSAASAIVLMEKKTISKLTGYLLLGTSAVMVLFTRSRSGMLLMCLILMVYYWFVIIRKRRIWQGIAISGVFITIAAIILHAFPVAIENALSRFVNQEDISGGRLELFDIYISAWFRDPWCMLFGYGAGSYGSIVRAHNSPHNMIADILIGWGIVGLILLCYCWGALYRCSAKYVDKKDKMLAYLPSLVAVLAAMAGQYITTGFPHMRLCFLLLAAKAFADDEAQVIKGKETAQ